MSFSRGPNIILDGLVGYYDVVNPDSYTSGSSIIYDISRQKNHGTITGTPTDNASFVSFNSSVSMSAAIPNVQTVSAWVNLQGNGFDLAFTPVYGENVYVYRSTSLSSEQINLNYYGTNDITNGTFDSDILGWSILDPADSIDFNSIVGAPGTSPQSSMNINIDADPRLNVVYQEITSLVDNRAYIISFWYKTKDITDGLRVALTQDYGRPHIVGKSSMKLPLSTDWRKFIWIVYTESSTDIPFLCLYKTGNIGQGSLNIDEITIGPADWFYEFGADFENVNITFTSDYGYNFPVFGTNSDADGLRRIYTGQLSNLMVYNRKLSLDEINTNVTTMRPRYF